MYFQGKKYFFTLYLICLFPILTSAQTLTVTMEGEYANALFGRSVACAGDINEDTYNDLIVGAYQYNSNKGRVYIYYTGLGMDGTPEITIDGQTSGERFGISVDSAGDVNNDGYDDIIVGAYTYGGHYGRAYIFGSSPN